METKDYKLSRYEMETCIRYCDDNKTVSVYTCSKGTANKLKKLAESYPEQYRMTRTDGTGYFFEIIDKKLISFRKPRILSDEQRKLAGDRLRQRSILASESPLN